MGGQSGLGGAAAPQGASPNFGPNMFGAQKPPPGQPAPLVPGTPGRQSDPLPTSDPMIAQRPPPGYPTPLVPGTPGRNSDPLPPNNPHVQPMLPPGLAQAFMGNQATQGNVLSQIMQNNQPTQGPSLPQIMQPPQSAMPDIAAMLAARKPAVQPVAAAPSLPLNPQGRQPGQSFADFRMQQIMDGGPVEKSRQRSRRLSRGR